MSVNENLLSKGLRQLIVLILLLIISPISLTIAFKALNKLSEERIWIAFIIFGVSVILILITLILAFKTFKTLLDALFNS